MKKQIRFLVLFSCLAPLHACTEVAEPPAVDTELSDSEGKEDLWMLPGLFRLPHVIDGARLRCRIARLAAARASQFEPVNLAIGATPQEATQMRLVLADLATQVCRAPGSTFDVPALSALHVLNVQIGSRNAAAWGVGLDEALVTAGDIRDEFARKLEERCGFDGKRVLNATAAQFDRDLPALARGQCSSRFGAGVDGSIAASIGREGTTLSSCLKRFSRLQRESCDDPRAEGGGPGGGTDWTSCGPGCREKYLVEKDGTYTKLTERNGTLEFSDLQGTPRTPPMAPVTSPPDVIVRNPPAITEASRRSLDEKVAELDLVVTVAGGATGSLVASLATPMPNTYKGAIVALAAFTGWVTREATDVRDSLRLHQEWTKKRRQCHYERVGPAAITFDMSGPGATDGATHAPTLTDELHDCMCEQSNQSRMRAPGGDLPGLELLDAMMNRCASAEDRARIACLKDSGGPDDGTRPECLALLQADNEEWAHRVDEERRCRLVLCPSARLSTPRWEGSRLHCDCGATSSGGTLLPPRDPCLFIRCPEQASCLCSGGTCGCQLPEVPPGCEDGAPTGPLGIPCPPHGPGPDPHP